MRGKLIPSSCGMGICCHSSHLTSKKTEWAWKKYFLKCFCRFERKGMSCQTRKFVNSHFGGKPFPDQRDREKEAGKKEISCSQPPLPNGISLLSTFFIISQCQCESATDKFPSTLFPNRRRLSQLLLHSV